MNFRTPLPLVSPQRRSCHTTRYVQKSLSFIYICTPGDTVQHGGVEARPTDMQLSLVHIWGYLSRADQLFKSTTESIGR